MWHFNESSNVFCWREKKTVAQTKLAVGSRVFGSCWERPTSNRERAPPSYNSDTTPRYPPTMSPIKTWIYSRFIKWTMDHANMIMSLSEEKKLNRITVNFKETFIKRQRTLFLCDTSKWSLWCTLVFTFLWLLSRSDIDLNIKTSFWNW